LPFVHSYDSYYSIHTGHKDIVTLTMECALTSLSYIVRTTQSLLKMSKPTVTYSMEEKLGEGSFGEVWKAFTPSGASYSKRKHPIVEMLVLEDPDEEAMIEFQLLKKLDHPYIVKYLDSFVRANGTCANLCIIMEYCDGGSFTKMIKTFSRKEFNIWRILRHVAKALAYLHKGNILHRDLKPDNLLAKYVGQRDPDTGLKMYILKLCNFGVAKLLNKKAQDTYYCTTGVDTPSYMAPEALQGGVERFTSSADIWALGALVAFLAERGKHLFPTENSVTRRRTGDYTLDPSKYSQDLIKMVDHMLHPHPRGRPTAAQLVKETRKGRRQEKPRESLLFRCRQAVENSYLYA